MANAQVGVGAGEDNIGVSIVAVGDEDLGAVEDVLVTLQDSSGAHAVGVGAGAGLGQTHGTQLLALSQGNQVLLLLLLGAELQDGPGAQRTVNGEHDGGGSAVLSQLLAADNVGQVGQTSAAVLLGDVGAQHAHLGQLLTGVASELFLLVQLSSDRLDFLDAEVMKHVENFLLHLVQFEIHNFFLSRLGAPPPLRGGHPQAILIFLLTN